MSGHARTEVVPGASNCALERRSAAGHWPPGARSPGGGRIPGPVQRCRGGVARTPAA
eukprot:CAMPEP_0206050546 /NCGR_PEP_ID=MMETSP1466-20131121/29456_1 /ASSEMBLY_ACC=CAM_ASM_001126 /TAXON_ID=44452 /ORGANISM="Pavlova gyrans, Strain CCMP608" /LENGTH=56 /DNA_ID=CAMNT_0053425663 /DNA_START=1 /DNA_END=167 /DNA_ORIENTATION=-